MKRLGSMVLNLALILPSCAEPARRLVQSPPRSPSETQPVSSTPIQDALAPELIQASVKESSSADEPHENADSPPGTEGKAVDDKRDKFVAGTTPPEERDIAKLKAPPLEPGDRAFPINLATALRLADARPLVVAIAQARAWVTEAQYRRARVYWVPAFMMQTDYSRHDGPIDFNQGINVPQGINALGQTNLGSFGKPLNQNINWFYSGVSFYEVLGLTDAIFLPLQEQQNLDAKRWDVQTNKNDALLRTAQAYFNVHKYRGQYAGAIYTVERGRDLVRRIHALGKDLNADVETDRARNLLADLEEQAVSAREEWRVASAELSRVLRLDPRSVIVPLERDHMQITLIDPERSLDELIPIGLTNRPELASHKAMVQRAAVRIRQEKLRPILPVILITGWETPGGMADQIGIFGTGADKKLNNWSFRDDISTQFIWQLESFGLGNMARVKKRRGEQSREIAELFREQDDIAKEITQTQADLQSAAARIVQAERSLQEALITYNRSVEGLGQTQRFGDVLYQIFRPQEVVYALQRLKISFDEYFATVADYNIAQFQLFHALGYPAQEISMFRLPGEVLPVDTQRPGYLPPVGIGPPPATR